MSALEITRKDLHLLVRDRRALAVLVALPLVFISLLGFSTSRLLGWKDRNQQLHVALIDDAESDLSLKVARAVELNSGLIIHRFAAVDEAAQYKSEDNESLQAMIVIRRDFDQQSPAATDTTAGVMPAADAVARLRDASIEFRTGDGELLESSPAGVVGIIARLVAAEVDQVLWFTGSDRRSDMAQPVDDPDPAADVTRSTVATDRSTEPDSATGSRSVYTEIVPSYTVLFVFFMVNVMGRSFIHEAQLGTLARLRLAPIGPLELMLGKTIPFFVISVAQTSILFLCGHFVFGMSLGASPWLLVPVILCTSLAATSLGLLFATLVRTESQVSAYGNLIVIAMAGVSGCFLPRDWLSESMQTASLITPHAWSLIAFAEVLAESAPGWLVVLKSCAVLTGFSGVCMYLGWRRFRGAQTG